MYFFNDPAKPFTLFTYYDILFLFIIVLLNYVIYYKNLKINAISKGLIFLVFFIVIPFYIKRNRTSQYQPKISGC